MSSDAQKGGIVFLACGVIGIGVSLVGILAVSAVMVTGWSARDAWENAWENAWVEPPPVKGTATRIFPGQAVAAFRQGRVVALVAPESKAGEESAPSSTDLYAGAQEALQAAGYDVQRVAFTRESPLPTAYDTLVVLGPTGLSERQRWELNRAFVNGKPTVLAIQRYTWAYKMSRTGGIQVTRHDEGPGVNPLLDHYGLSVSEDILMDANSVALTVPGEGDGIGTVLERQTMNLPTHMLAASGAMSKRSSDTEWSSNVVYLWGTAIEVDAARGLKATALLSSSDEAWTVPGDREVTSEFFEKPATGLKRYPLMVSVVGRFPDAYQGRPRPHWPDADTVEGDAEPLTPALGRLILLGSAAMFQGELCSGDNQALLVNAVDSVTFSWL